MRWLQHMSWLRGSCGILLFVLSTLCISSALAQAHTAKPPPLRHTEALDTLIADLEDYIPVTTACPSPMTSPPVPWAARRNGPFSNLFSDVGAVYSCQQTKAKYYHSGFLGCGGQA